MKPAPFHYEAVRSTEAALQLLGEDAKALAGGQSLVPMLNFRLARPQLLVDLNPIAELAYLRRAGGELHIGALTRHATLERSGLVQRGWPLLAQAVRMVGHAAIRSRGTVGGSVAHADPAGELPAALTALDARFHLTSVRGERSLSAGEFFRGRMTTALEADELLCEIVVPPLPAGSRCAFIEHSRTHCDFAIAGAGVVVAPGGQSAIALLGAGPTPVRAAAAERALAAGAGAREAGRLAGAEARGEYRGALIAELVRRAIERASGPGSG
jgi:CO/xanthine dehydrogenase FAD-binding subunit